MAISYVGSGEATTSVAVSEATLLGDQIVVFTSASGAPTDTAGNTYTALETVGGASAFNAYVCLSAKASGAGTNTISQHGTGSTGPVAYWHGRGANGTDNNAVSYATNTGTPPNPGNVTTSNAGETIVVAARHTSGVNTNGASYVLRLGTATASIQDWIGAGSGSQATAFVGNSVTWFAVAVTLTAPALTATSTVTFGETGNLTGVGALAGVSTLTFPETGNLGGAGTLAATSTVTFPETGNLGGAGALAATSTVTFPETGNLGGAGTLAATSTVTFPETGNLGGAGALAATSTVTFPETGNLGGAGALAATSTVTFPETGNLGGAGALAATSTVTFPETGNLGGACAHLLPHPP